MATLNDKLQEFIVKSNQMALLDGVPVWFLDFQADLVGLLGEISNSMNVTSTKVCKLEGDLAKIEAELSIQKAVTNALHGERDRLVRQVRDLEVAMDDLEQYSRRNCVLFHGIKEEASEKTTQKVLDILEKDLDVPISRYEIGRTHRLGRKRDGEDARPRPIIVRFISHRQKRMTFRNVKNLKGKGTFITENLTKQRLSLYKQCKDEFEDVWVRDGKIFCTDKLGFRFAVTKAEDMLSSDYPVFYPSSF